MLTARDVWLGIMLPAVLAAATMFVAHRAIKRRVGRRVSRTWSAPLAVALGVFTGTLALFGWPGVPPLDATEWPVLLILPLAAIAVVDARSDLVPPARFAIALAVVAVSLWLIARPLLEGDALGERPLEELALAAVLITAATASLEAISARGTAGAFTAILLAAIGGAALTLAMSGSQRLGQMAAALAAALGGGLVAGVVLGRGPAPRGLALVVGLTYLELLICGYLYAELTAGNFVLLAIAPQAAWLAHPWVRRGAWAAQAWQVACVALVAGLAVYRAWATFAADTSGH
jgi:hypothetical protein